MYDRTVEPPRFSGAVGVDFLASAAEKIYGGTVEETAEAIKRITSKIADVNFAFECDKLNFNLSYCALQGLRQYSAGNSSVCIPDRFQNDEGRLDYEAVDAYIIEQNLTEYVSLQFTVDTMNTTNENETALNETNTIVTAIPVESSSDISIDTLLELLYCSQAVVIPCSGREEYPR